MEWPGGQALQAQLKTNSKVLAAVMRGSRKSIPFASEHLKEFACLPWASVLEFECEEGAKAQALVGLARFANSKTNPDSGICP
jgi:hypothetical protein